MHETTFEELKRYVRFDKEDAKALLAFKPIATPHFEQVARKFYERIREHEEAHAVFTGEKQIERLQRSMVEWLTRLLSGSYDESYFERSLAIGRMHVRVGLPQYFVFSAMALIRVALDEIADEALGAPSAKVRSALNRLLDLELAIMVECYRRDPAEQAMRRAERDAKEKHPDLAHTLRLYTTAVDVTPSLVIGLDAHGAIRLFNRSAERLTGYASIDVLGSSFVETLVAEEARATDEGLIANLLAGPPCERDEQSIVRARSGRLLDIRWHFSRIKADAPGDIVLLAIGADVTDSQIASMQLHRHERLAALGTLAAGLAHEIRNPLNGAQLHVAFLLRALERKQAEPEMIEAANVVADEIKRLARLVAEFLDFARPSALNKKHMTIQALVTRVLELTVPQAAAQGITLSTDLPPQDLVVVADVGKLEQVLLNIVQNAIDVLAPSGTGNVIVRARRKPRTVAVEVEDDGPGLPSPNAPVFDAFFSTKPTGTGLGLAITHRIVTDHGGLVDVESRPGRTCFRFTIPVGIDRAGSEDQTP